MQTSSFSVSVRDGDGWRPLKSVTGVSIAEMTRDMPRRPKRLNFSCSGSFDWTLTSKKNWCKVMKACELRDFAPFLPEPYRGAMLGRAESLLEQA